VVGAEALEAMSFAKGVREVLAGLKEEYSLEYPCHSPTEKRWFVGRVTRFVGDGPTRLVIAHEDVTERVLALNELRDSRALLAEMGRTAQIGGWETDPETGTRSWTDEVARIYGMDANTPMDIERTLDCYVGESRRAIEEALKAACEQGTPYDLELKFQAADGVRKWVRTIANPEMKDGRVVRVRGSIQDITERKKADLALRESETLFSTIFRVSPVAINIFRISDGRSILANDQFLTLTGFSRDEIIGHTAAELGLLADPQARPLFMKKLQESGHLNMASSRIRSKSGDVRDALSSMHAVTLSGEQAVIVVATDITDQKRAEAEIEALREQFLHSQKMEAVGRLAGGVAHDFNNLLQVINGYSERITEDYANDPTLLRYGKSIQKAGDIAKNLTKQLLAFSRKAPTESRKVELDSVVAGMEDMVRRLVGEDISVQLDLNLPGHFIEIDPSQVEQIVLNLAVNSRDAMPKGGLLHLSTVIGKASGNRAGPNPVELIVSDSGHGMDLETQKRVFEPFFTTKPLGRGNAADGSKLRVNPV
jgi:PAS domain S-box-containing protein